VRLVIVSHKPCWPSAASPTGYATDGGFPMQVRALSELFDSTTLAVPCDPPSDDRGALPLVGRNLSVLPLSPPRGRRLWRKLGMPLWLAGNGWRLRRAIRAADAVHAIIPGDVGTLGMLLAARMGKPLFVRHCGNWTAPRTIAEHFWRRYMERHAGGRNVMLATGGSDQPPSERNAAVRWIFSTSMTEQELASSAAPNGRAGRLPRRLIIVCRQEKRKGTDVLLRSLRLLLKDLPDTALDVVGDGGELLALRALAEELGIGPRVVFHGRVEHEEVIRLLHEADLFCYPTTASEGFPKVVVEALACGVPVVTNPVSVLPRLLSDGAGLIVDETTPEKFAQAAREVLTDAKRYHTMSAQARETARRYSLEHWRDTIGGLLESAWGRPLRSPA
jgi:glycosyltransferase involved in cell wall biosynthesis